MHVANLTADDFVLDPEFLEHPAIVAAGPFGALVILAALLYCHRHGTAAAPRAVLERGLPRAAARRAIGTCERLELLARVDDAGQAFAVAGYARDAGTDGGTRRRRVLAAIRARRYRARGDRAIDVPLPFDDDAENCARAISDRPRSGRHDAADVWITCAKPVGVTHDVTHPVTLSRGRDRRSLSSMKDLEDLDHRRTAPDRTSTAPRGAAHEKCTRAHRPRPRFALLCAVVRAEAEAHPAIAADRGELLERVKTVCARARLAPRPDDVHKAIEAVVVARSRA